MSSSQIRCLTLDTCHCSWLKTLSLRSIQMVQRVMPLRRCQIWNISPYFLGILSPKITCFLRCKLPNQHASWLHLPGWNSMISSTYMHAHCMSLSTYIIRWVTDPSKVKIRRTFSLSVPKKNLNAFPSTPKLACVFTLVEHESCPLSQFWAMI